eukprot:jgi/Mesvir1/14728/Mv05376-RA.1
MADGIYTELAGATKPDASTASDESLIPHDTLPVPVEDVPVTETEISPSRIPPEMLAARQFESLVHKAFLLLSGLSVVCLLVLALVIYCLVTRQDTYDLIVTGNVKDLSGLSIFTGSGSWCSKKDLPDARADFQAVAVNGSIYILGGVGTRRDVLNSTLRYNPVYQRYRYLALMPEPRYRYGAAHLDGRIYVVGGYNTAEDALPQQCMLVYTIASNSWEWGACTNDYHSDTCAVAINGKVCEQHCDDQACHDDCSEQGMKSVEEFLDTMSQDVFLVKGGPLDRGRMR